MIQFFAEEGLDRAGHRREEADWIRKAAASPSSGFVLFQDGRPLLREAPDGLRIGWISPDGLPPTETTVFLGMAGDSPRFASSAKEAPEGRNLVKRDLRAAAMRLTAPEAGILAHAQAMLRWHRNCGYCPRCGKGTEPSQAGDRRQCTGCATVHFPKVSPVAIMLVHSGDRCLLGRQPGFPPRLFSCLAGFIEPGESIAACVAREVMEEARVRVLRTEFYGDQPWPWPGQLMLGCLAEAEHTEPEVDGNELEEARWFTRDEVRQILGRRHPEGLAVPPPLAIAHSLIREWGNR
jgi:NAD+ diphosphatase